MYESRPKRAIKAWRACPSAEVSNDRLRTQCLIDPWHEQENVPLALACTYGSTYTVFHKYKFGTIEKGKIAYTNLFNIPEKEMLEKKPNLPSLKDKSSMKKQPKQFNRNNMQKPSPGRDFSLPKKKTFTV
ncbi:hypothetical protein [Siminovitchia fordii]|uniref:hypothetical protein n=1 Tax=Siminovitchia fordii TaxID=254759 RepID=UPI001B7FE971|nr:hypothetical protein [Siminovitchia fordii]